MVILTSILVLPYWIYIPILFIGLIFFPFFWEGILAVFLITIIHNSEMETLSLLVSPLVLSVLITLIIMLPIRESLRSYV
ncbi:MAG: hypothetical protein Q7R89_00325 [bacterium]|nr:hypothetical protein [bacterium]